jgi:MFS family permease
LAQISEDRPATGIIETQWKAIAIFSGIATTNAVLSYGWVPSIPGYLKAEQRLSMGLSTLSTNIALLALLPLLYLSGRVSDRIDRKRMLLGGTTSAMITAPLSLSINENCRMSNAVVAQLIYLIPMFSYRCLPSATRNYSSQSVQPIRVRFVGSAQEDTRRSSGVHAPPSTTGSEIPGR